MHSPTAETTVEGTEGIRFDESDEDITPKRSTKQPLCRREKRSVKEEEDNTQQKVLKKALIILENSDKDEHKDDIFDKFRKYIACQPREMDSRDSEFVQFKIQEVIFQAKFYGNGHARPQIVNHSQTAMPASSSYLEFLQDKNV